MTAMPYDRPPFFPSVEREDGAIRIALEWNEAAL